MYRNSGSPRDTPTTRLAAIGAQSRDISRRRPSNRTKAHSTRDETMTSQPKKLYRGAEQLIDEFADVQAVSAQER
jgi:hypothetical protein